jgi:hypothetical protein
MEVEVVQVRLITLAREAENSRSQDGAGKDTREEEHEGNWQKTNVGSEAEGVKVVRGVKTALVMTCG